VRADENVPIDTLLTWDTEGDEHVDVEDLDDNDDKEWREVAEAREARLTLLPVKESRLQLSR